MNTELEEVRFKYGRSARRVSFLLVASFLSLESLLIASCFFAPTSTGEWFGDVIMAGVFFLLHGAVFAVFLVKVTHRHSGYVVITDAGLKIELGGTARFVPWDSIGTVAKGYRLLVSSPAAPRTLTEESSGATTVIIEESRSKRDTKFAMSSISVDPYTIHITVESEPESPIVLNRLMFYEWKLAFGAIVDAVAKHLPDRFMPSTVEAE